jgi:hypothetical protein
MKHPFFIIFLTLFTSCSFNERKEKLAENFVDMRNIPSSILTVKSIGNYEIGYQDASDISKMYNYPNNYVVGILDNSKNNYKYITYVENISPIDNYEYINSVLDFFESDSTQVRTLLKGDNNKIRVNIYRKVNNNSELKLEWAMWKWLYTENGQLKFETKEFMNQHLFN